ncbi:MAG TPA: hypothetical protein VEZ11_00390 [Thermoanaerobaculia bacterium]|nr:hypothetical protein [Thermoanaerobaculia bacterium]
MSDRTAFLTVNLASALVDRIRPTITTWNRLEGRPRTLNFARALKAEVRDALWMLTKQWQLGEFHGDDAGSPIEARMRITRSRLRSYRAGASGIVEAFDDSLPLETKVERRPVALTLEIRLMMGRQWLKILPVAALRSEFIRQYPIARPNPASDADAPICAHQEAWSEFAAHAGRSMDGAALYQHLSSGGHAADGIAGSAGHEAELDDAATRFTKWFETLIAQPSQNEAWIPSRLEYQFACSAPVSPAAEKILDAAEYYSGHLDWYSVDVGPGAVLGSPLPDPENPKTDKRALVPTPASFNGMPNTRWWAFEEGRTNFGDIKPDTTDLAKLLLIEFGLIYANDWFVIPYTLPSGSIVHVDGLAVTNVFGERYWIEAAGSRKREAWQHWTMFAESVEAPAGAPPDLTLVLFPSATKVDDAAPVEEIMLIRDEVANMVWAVENTIPLPTGEPKRGLEAARELRAFLEQRLPPPPPPPAPVAPIRYDLMSSVPENWIPFIPVHRDAADFRSIQLQRAAMLRVLEGDPNPPVKIEPRTSLIRAGLDAHQTYFLNEEEVPRAGVVVTQRYRPTRWRDGRAWIWLGVRKQTGRGEGSSGLAFDRILNVTK